MSLLESERVRGLLAAAGLDGLSARATAGVLCVAGVVVALAVWRFWPAAPAPEVAFYEGEAAVPIDVSAETSEAPPAEVVVHVAGAVLRPGVYALPPASRVTDAIAAAGGPLGSAACDALNLARIVSDAERVYVPTRDEVDSGGDATGVGGWESGGAGATAVSEAGVVDINRATASELETLPGVGPATAEKIVDDREANGPFAKPEDLMRVPGIGPKKFEAMQAQVSVG